MSGFVVQYSPEGTVNTAVTRSLAAPLAYRGEVSWFRSSERISSIVYESDVQNRSTEQPFVRDGVWVVLDGRIDNSEELSEELNSSDPTSDVELLSALYSRFGKACFERIYGDFAAVIFDESRGCVLCGRDRIGVRHAYYSAIGDEVVIASEQSGLTSHPRFSPEPNETMLGRFLCGSLTSTNETFYRDVYRVRPGELVTFSRRGTEHDRYWDPSALTEFETDDVDDLSAELYSLIRTAVSQAFSGHTNAAVMMSGGKDSTAVASVLQNDFVPSSGVNCFSFLSSNDDICEEGNIDTVRDEYGLLVNKVRQDGTFDPNTLLRGRGTGSSPCTNPNIFLARSIFEVAAERGYNVLLTGEGGNLFDGTRTRYIDFVRRLQPKRAITHLFNDSKPLPGILLDDVLAPVVLSTPARPYRVQENAHHLSSHFVDSIDLVDRDARSGVFGDFDDYTKRSLAGMLLPDRLLRLDHNRKVALENGIELRHPFLDARILEFLFRLPPHALTPQGRTKGLFLAAVGHRLPSSIRNQRKDNVATPLIVNGMEKYREDLTSICNEPELEARGYIPSGKLNDVLASCLDDGDITVSDAWRFISTEMWLRRLN